MLPLRCAGLVPHLPVPGVDERTNGGGGGVARNLMYDDDFTSLLILLLSTIDRSIDSSVVVLIFGIFFSFFTSEYCLPQILE